MNNHWKIRKNKSNGGQAFVELGILFTVIMAITFATIDIGRMVGLSVRMASVTREAGRTYKAMQIDDSQAPDGIYSRMISMIAPSKIESEGQVVFSVLKRIDPNDDTIYTDPDSYDDDYVEIVHQFFYKGAGTAAYADRRWDSKIGVVGTKVAHYPPQEADIMPLQMLRIDQTTVSVEVFHNKVFITPAKAFLDFSDKPLYDRAIF
jgi:hypothetical protein